MPGWWFEPLWKIWKSVGIILPNIWKVKKIMFQTTNQMPSDLTARKQQDQLSRSSRLEWALHVALSGLQCLRLRPTRILTRKTSRTWAAFIKIQFLDGIQMGVNANHQWERFGQYENMWGWQVDSHDVWLGLAEGPIHNGYYRIIQCGNRHAHIILGFTNWCLVSLALNQSITSSAWCYPPDLRFAYMGPQTCFFSQIQSYSSSRWANVPFIHPCKVQEISRIPALSRQQHICKRN